MLRSNVRTHYRNLIDLRILSERVPWAGYIPVFIGSCLSHKENKPLSIHYVCMYLPVFFHVHML